MQKILIANRGEIACRIIRTARNMGIKTVAVFSDADREAPHVALADEAVRLGESPSHASYLAAPKLLEAAKKTAADAIHPGYGFLSENADFAKGVFNAGLKFIGPPPAAIETMGNKLAAKDAVRKFDIPLVPGTEEAISDPTTAKAVIDEIGLPVLIKASAGGGGKGMRIVDDAADLQNQIERAISEATSAFGDGSVFIEKYISAPKHIEVQILADQHGNTVHLFERDCSIQRRHQKVIEEAPGPTIDVPLRSRLGSAAVKVAQACKYVGAGTVEFLLDQNGAFYFLEMNTRLQVEHPVTECITGLDLVEQQIRIARGEALSFNQEDIEIDGHAIELRVYAEDPSDDFVPSVGNLAIYRPPSGPGIRVDDGYREGMDIPIYYDPMLAKLICHGKDRKEAMHRLKTAIEQYQINGIKTTLPFGKFVLEHALFKDGSFDTHFVQQFFSADLLRKQKESELQLAAKLGLHFYLEAQQKLSVPPLVKSQWKSQRKKNR